MENFYFLESRKVSSESKKFLFSGACMRRLMLFSLHFIQTHTIFILPYLTDIQTTNKRQYLSHREHTEHSNNIVEWYNVEWCRKVRQRV